MLGGLRRLRKRRKAKLAQGIGILVLGDMPETLLEQTDSQGGTRPTAGPDVLES